MNIAFQAIVLLLLYLPGALLLHAYYGKLGGSKDLPISTPSVTTRTVVALVLASALHAIWVTLANFVGGRQGLQVDLNSVLFFLVGRYDEPTGYARAIHSIVDWPYLVFSYFVSLYMASTLLGVASHQLVRTQGWDRMYRVLRFSDNWHYMFSGEIFEFSEYAPEESGVEGVDTGDDEDESIDGTIVAAALELGGQAYLYVGLLEGYWYDDKGILDAIWLSNVFRRDLTKDRKRDEPPQTDLSADDRYYAVDGDFFVLKFADLKNVNIKYISVEAEDQAPLGEGQEI